MKGIFKSLVSLLICLGFGVNVAYAATDNQTADLSPISSESALPFSIEIKLANFQLPQGVHSGVVGFFHGKWILIAGRTNGLHGFDPGPGNFPPSKQNTSIYVVDPATGAVFSRSLTDPSSGLSQQQIDDLSVTSPQGYQDGDTLYMTGGYGYDRGTDTYSTKPMLTAFRLQGIVQWVMQPGNKNNSVIKNIQQITNPEFQITGGRMYKLGNVMQLVFGQNFTGLYSTGSNGIYSQQVRQFIIKNSNGRLAVEILDSKPHFPDPNFRRRDLNVMPVLMTKNNLLQPGLVAYSGVFTEATGIWTVPVVIDSTGNPVMADPILPSTFKQGMNNYVSATAGLYSQKSSSMYNIFLGGISFGFYDSGVFTTDNEIPFINQVTTVQMDKNGHFTQYLMNNQYPVILSTQTNPGNQLLFGAGANFIPNALAHYANGVLNLDSIRQPTVIGHIVGGIMSTVPNTDTQADSTASPYIFTVTLIPR